MHRAIQKVEDSHILVDHHDGNGLNNQKYNHRVTDKRGNGKNKVAKSTNIYSSFKGVSFRKDTGKFVAHIHIDGVQKSLGCRETDIECAKLYDEAAITHFGEFAKLNFPLGEV